jgi:hypothetical protein
MAFHAGRRVDPAVDLVLVEIISPVRQRPFGGIFELVAWFYLLFVCMTVQTVGFRMADIAGLLVLRCVELVLFDPIRPVVQVVQCRSDIRMTFTAQWCVTDLHGVLHGNIPVDGTGKQQQAGHGQNSEDECFDVLIDHDLSFPKASRQAGF